MTILPVLICFSSLSFLFFGITCLFAPIMKTEFIRYGVPQYRVYVGILQLLGAIGLFLGYLFFMPLVMISAIGLAMLMILGFGIRLKIKDTFIQSFPSFFYAVLNGYIAFLLCAYMQ